MTKKKKKKRSWKLYRLGLRMALVTSLVSALVILLLLWVGLDLDLRESSTYAILMLPVFFIVAYTVNYRMNYRRLEMLETISKNIARKRFKEYYDVTTRHNDEIDYLIRESAKSSRTIEREIQRLNRIENYRKEFIGDISHELKTPVFAIQGFIETLLNGALEDEEVNRDFLRKAMRNVNRLIYLTKDLMEISKLETGELKSEIEEIYLYDVIHDILETLHYKAEKERIELNVQDFDRNIRVRADKNQLKQVLINLIENGIKYNQPGGRVELSVKSEPTNPDRVFVEVQDTGIGIDEKDIPRVTERFFRVDKSRSRERGGTGLGLAIVKHILEAHGEKFMIRSTPNMGSTFTFTLRRADVHSL